MAAVVISEGEDNLLRTIVNGRNRSIVYPQDCPRASPSHSPVFELAYVLMRFYHVARMIVNPNLISPQNILSQRRTPPNVQFPGQQGSCFRDSLSIPSKSPFAPASSPFPSASAFSAATRLQIAPAQSEKSQIQIVPSHRLLFFFTSIMGRRKGA